MEVQAIGALTAGWLRNLLTNLALLAIGGLVIWKLQDRWIRRRVRAAKDFEIQREIYRQLTTLVADIAEIRVLLLRDEPGDQGRAHHLIALATERAYRMADEARLLYEDTLQHAQFDLLVANLGSIQPGTGVGRNELDQLRDAVFELR